MKKAARAVLAIVALLFLVAALSVLLSKPARAADAPMCTDGWYILKVNVWSREALDLPGVARTHQLEQRLEEFTGAWHVSRKHGAGFRKAFSAGQLKRSSTIHTFQVSFIMTPEASGGAPTISSEMVIGEVTVVGLRELKFTRSQLERWDAIRLVSVTGEIASPPRYALTASQEIRFFNRLPRTTLGEWDNNPTPADCTMNEHWIEK